MQSPNSTNEGNWVYRIVLGGHGVHCTRGLYAVLLQGVQHAEDTDPMPVFPMGQPGLVREVPGAQTAGERCVEVVGRRISFRVVVGAQATYDIDVQDGEYLRHGETPLLARLFIPRGSGPFPIMVELHGGAWERGDLLNGNAANEALAKSGVIVAALDFRVPPVASYPASLADIHH